MEITDELVERLKRDTPTVEALPLLAFTLEKLYRGYASDGKLDLHEYESLGGMEGSIQTCIERIAPGDSLSASDAAALRLSFVAQVNDKGEVVRLRARWDDLPSAAKPILERFVNERLLSVSAVVGKCRFQLKRRLGVSDFSSESTILIEILVPDTALRRAELGRGLPARTLSSGRCSASVRF